MSMDSRLTEILVCPVCKGPLRMNPEKTELHCAKCALGFKIVNDIPVMLASEARGLSPEEVAKARVNDIRS